MQDWQILVVDDEPDVHAVTNLALKKKLWRGRNFTITSASSAKEAEGILAEKGDLFDVALVDVVMETDQAGLDQSSHRFWRAKWPTSRTSDQRMNICATRGSVQSCSWMSSGSAETSIASRRRRTESDSLFIIGLAILPEWSSFCQLSESVVGDPDGNHPPAYCRVGSGAVIEAV